MLWVICVILLIPWLLGTLSGYTMGGVIHILPVTAIIVVLVRVIQGRGPSGAPSHRDASGTYDLSQSLMGARSYRGKRRVVLGYQPHPYDKRVLLPRSYHGLNES
jgi:hypothetical protein